MKCVPHGDAASLLKAVGEHLAAREAENNLMLGIALARAEAERADIPLDPIFVAHIEDGDRPVAALMRTPPYPLLITTFNDNARFIVSAAQFVFEQGLDVSGVVSANEVADAFASTWLERAPDLAVSHVVLERLYQIGRSPDVPMRAGRLVTAGPEHYALLVDWFRAFHKEALPNEEVRDHAQGVAFRIEHGSLFIWEENGSPLGMAGSSRSTPNGICVNAVYTPPQYRGRGVATSCVAALTRLLLRDKRFCVLFADLANPVSNSIYLRLGYQPVRDFKLIHFR